MILIGLGANLDSEYGTPEETLSKCIREFSNKNIEVIKCSSIWASAPVPISDQPWYKNAVCVVETDLSASDVMGVLNEIEGSFGRVRHERNAPRVLDLDLLAYNDEIISDAELTVPHPRMHERAFVLYPLKEIVLEWLHPVLKQSLDQMISAMPQGQEIKRLEKAA